LQPVGPITLALNVPTTEADPQQVLGTVSAAVQIQNSSVFQLQVFSLGDPYTIQPFTAQTIPTGGQPITITPTQDPSSLTDAETITIVWLLRGENPPQQDGPLTAAAIEAAIAGLTFTPSGALNINVQEVNGFNPVESSFFVAEITLAGPGTPVQFPSQVVNRGATFYADPNNNAAGVGIGTAASQPITLLPGAWGPGLPINNLDLVWAEGAIGDHLSAVGV